MKTCPQCAEAVQDEARICRYCRHEFGRSSRQTAGWLAAGAFVVLVLVVEGTRVPAPSGSPPSAVSPAAGTQPTAAAAVQPTGNRYNDELLAKSGWEQRTIFSRLMRGSDERCGTVTRAFYQGMEKGKREAFWNISCSEGTDWVVSIDRRSRTRLLECGTLKAVGGPRCFERFDD